VFNTQQRLGILLLVLLNVGLLFGYFYVSFSEEELFDVSSSEILQLQANLDSLREIAIEERKPKQYPFNPNYLTDYKAYTLNVPSESFDKLKAFRKQNKWINSVADFQKVTGVSDSLLETISPLFKFPDWVTNPRPKRTIKDWASSTEEKPYQDKIDLNMATIAELKKIYGIGEALSRRIVAYREKLGGFNSDAQLSNVWGLDEAVEKRVLGSFTVKTPKEIQKINLQVASASDIATIPGISFELAVSIWEFVKLRDGITSLTELEKIEKLSPSKFKLITLYLYVE
jgi:competence protein ComEA